MCIIKWGFILDMVKINLDDSNDFLVFIIKNETKVLSKSLSGDLKKHMVNLSYRTCKRIEACQGGNHKLPLQDCNIIMMSLIDFILHFNDEIIANPVRGRSDLKNVKHHAKIALKASKALNKMVEVIKANGYHEAQLSDFENKNKVFNNVINDLTKSL